MTLEETVLFQRFNITGYQSFWPNGKAPDRNSGQGGSTPSEDSKGSVAEW